MARPVQFSSDSHGHTTWMIPVVVMMLLAGVISGCNDQGNPVPNRANPVPNSGHSLLYISADMNGNEFLSMINASDGRQLWQYPVHGEIATAGYPPSTISQAVQIFAGHVYFAVAQPNHLNPTSFLLIALRASNGTPLWQQPIKVPSLTMIGVTAGEVCLWASSQAYPQSINPLSVYGYNAATGKLDWQRSLRDIAVNAAYPFSPLFVVDAILYFFGVSPSTTQKHPGVSTLIAVQPQTGQMLWQRQLPGDQSYPLAGDNGIVIVSLTSGNIFQPQTIKTSLMGLNESDGSTVWQQDIPLIEAVGFTNPLAITQPEAHIFCLMTTAPLSERNAGYMEVHALRISDGASLWQQRIPAAQRDLLTVFRRTADTLIVGVEANNSPNMHPNLIAASLTAWRVSTGKLLWQRHEERLSGNRDTGTLTDIAPANNTLLYLKDQLTLYALNTSDGATLSQYPLPDRNAWPLMATNGMAIFTYLLSEQPNVITRTQAFAPNHAGPLWSYDLQGQLYTIELGP